jgi:hypothetical protein
VTDERLLSENEAALVFRRAAELEATAPGQQPAFDAQTLERIGVEAGLSPAAVRQAVAELRAGRLEPTGRRRRAIPALVPHEIVLERRLSSPSSTVNQRLETYLRHQMFRVCRRRGDLTVWEPNRGLVANLVRGTDVIDRMRLSKVDGVQLHVEATGSGSHVRIVLDLGRARTNARTGSITGAALGATGFAAAAAGIALGAGELALALPFTTAGAAGAFIGARSNYAKKVKRAVDALELVLDELER